MNDTQAQQRHMGSRAVTLRHQDILNALTDALHESRGGNDAASQESIVYAIRAFAAEADLDTAHVEALNDYQTPRSFPPAEIG